LALGSMAGNKQLVYAIDSFEGTPPDDRQSAFGVIPGWGSSSPERLRRNLDSVGVNGLVKIIAKPSCDAIAYVPCCGLLFIDGGHEYETVSRDLELYLPSVLPRGTVVVHDCWENDPGVVRAFDEKVMSNPQQWRISKRVDSAIIFENRPTSRHTVSLAFPGGNLDWQAAKGFMQATLGAHDVTLENSRMGWDDMNTLWVRALNAAAHGEVTHFAMLHSDIQPSAGWLDVLLGEMDDRDADMVSAVVALKNHHGLTSCGVGDLDNPWEPFRRFTTRELMEFPETFSIFDTPHPDRYLLHNSGCMVVDLRKPLWRTVDSDSCLKACFSFPIRARILPDGKVVHERESEDWFFSRQIAALGAKTFATRKVETWHFGNSGFANYFAWGDYQDGDEQTASKWREVINGHAT